MCGEQPSVNQPEISHEVLLTIGSRLKRMPTNETQVSPMPSHATAYRPTSTNWAELPRLPLKPTYGRQPDGKRPTAPCTANATAPNFRKGNQQPPPTIKMPTSSCQHYPKVSILGSPVRVRNKMKGEERSPKIYNVERQPITEDWVGSGICVLVACVASRRNVSAHAVSRLFPRGTVRAGGAITSPFTVTIALQAEPTSADAGGGAKRYNKLR